MPFKGKERVCASPLIVTHIAISHRHCLLGTKARIVMGMEAVLV